MVTFSRFIVPVCLSISLSLCAALPRDAYAQETEAAQENAASDTEDEPTEAVRPSEGPFIEAMSRLSTVLGSMHFLGALCRDNEPSNWRDQMGAFLAAQKPTDVDKRRLIASFNSGYRAFESTYRSCTAAARLAHNRYREEGEALTRDMLTRYGN